MHYKKRIYICSPYRGATWVNTLIARALCRRALANGAAPYAPHLYLPDILNDNDPVERAAGIQAGIEFLKMCHEIWIYTPAGISAGMRQEIDEAAKLKIKRVAITRPVVFRERYQVIADWLMTKARETHGSKKN